MDDTATVDAAADGEAGEAPATRRWWQRLPMLIAVGVLPVPLGLFFLAFVGMAMLLSDQTRETEVRAGGSVLLFWWAYSFREGDTTPYLGAVLLAIGATLLVKGALRRRAAGGRVAWVPVLGAVLAGALAVAGFVPYGYREREVTRDEAVRRTFEQRKVRPWRGIGATDYLVEQGRMRLLHKPYWYVALYERNPAVARTVDGQPCFSRREVWRVDALDGAVSRATYDEAIVGGDPCLPVRLGTERDLRPAPA